MFQKSNDLLFISENKAALPACRPQYKGIVTRCGSAGKKIQLRSGCFRYLSAVKTCFEAQSGNLID